ncbi:MAG: undecaprenyldiphospho-muramoylpentapeptide beta-N-acetylglucosaminyltransferase [Chitinophagales bacterium]|nr:undecaprenyldiphospho-muramoylpentapeptide beta-N-acetylglucosaminyltransferase [Chitinophagales bacterium]MDW8418838.1 undecaprenyldiphospho-muramoylpentapeptide beta-N-acetylglucosaminyltransferase [Chitinophagales bacterium]
MSARRIFISGGGTGGHIFPAIAIANALKEKLPDADILFIGAEGRMEMERVPQAGYPIVGLPIAGFQRSHFLKNISLPYKVMQSMFRAYRLVKLHRPCVAIGVGGYASFPVLQAAALCGVPTVIQEQNSYAGITNRILGKTARLICTAYEGMEKFFPVKNILLTGNPVRKEIADIRVTREEGCAYYQLNPAMKTLLVTGGSLGARTINHSILAGLRAIYESDVQVLWQTGRMYYEECAAAAAGYTRVQVHRFLDRMDMAYACADVIISRAGALSIAELQCVGKPAILVPSPNVAEDHQTHNAMSLVRKQAALMIRDDEAHLKLVPSALDLLRNEVHRKTLSENIRSMARPYAAEQIADAVMRIAGLLNDKS